MTKGARLRALSGAGGKGPACFLLETDHARLLLDLGYGPQPGVWPNLDGVGRVDAIVLTHAHADHAGGLSLADQIGSPTVYATAAVLEQIGCRLPTRELPVNGVATLCDIPFTTGRNGHAPGGVWLHAALGEGLLYTGDYAVESLIYAFDAPPPATTVILDASYGAYEDSLDTCIARLAPYLDAGRCLLPVPAMGRGAEMAWQYAQHTGCLPRLADDVRTAIARLAADPAAHAIKPEAVASLRTLAADAPAAADGDAPLFVSPADGSRGAAAAHLEQWANGTDPIVFTGYLPPGTPAQALTDSGRAHYVRWNVHPRLGDNVALARACGARTVLPAFGDRRHLDIWAQAFSPARILLNDSHTL
jgi:hypothetical protein